LTEGVDVPGIDAVVFASPLNHDVAHMILVDLVRSCENEMSREELR